MAKTLLIEIGSEELPSRLIAAVVPQFQAAIAKGLAAAGLSAGEVHVFSTPRRIAVLVEDVAEKTPEVHEVRRGPKAEAAFDADGNPTQAAIGFACSANTTPEKLMQKEEGGATYVFAQIDKSAKDAKTILPALIENVLAQLKWPKSQRWGDVNVMYGRPLRWIVALFGNQLLDITFGDVTSSNKSRGHRVLGSQEVTINVPESYVEELEKNGVMSREKRAQTIRRQIHQIEENQNVIVDMPSQTFEEVVDLCEWPEALVGHFDEEFLRIPHEIICESMLSHQRYFPIYEKVLQDGGGAKGRASQSDNAANATVNAPDTSSTSNDKASEKGPLTTGFVIVSNGGSAFAKDIIEGNERVVRARLDDAKFFFETDVRIPLGSREDQLKEVVFQEKLGTLFDKTERLKALAPLIVHEAHGTQEEAKKAVRAAHLAKADLVSQTVIEFTSQQGVMGGYFAKAQGEDAEVAQAIAQQYMPRFANDGLPQTLVGQAVAIADKLDTLTGMFAIGEPPTGSSDPFALRRGAIGIIRMLEVLDAVSLQDLIDASLDAYKNQGLTFDTEKVRIAIQEFFLNRLATMAKEHGASAEAIRAIENIHIIDPAAFFERVRILDEARQKDPQLYEDLATSFSRAHNLIEKAAGKQNQKGATEKQNCKDPAEGTLSVDEALLGAQEDDLLKACTKAETQVQQALASKDFAKALNTLAALRGPIDLFFENVMVMDEDPKLRANRLVLLDKFLHLFDEVADISVLAKSA